MTSDVSFGKQNSFGMQKSLQEELAVKISDMCRSGYLEDAVRDILQRKMVYKKAQIELYFD